MDTGRTAAIAVAAQWLRCAHSGTALTSDDDAVTLEWQIPAAEPGAGSGTAPAGLAVGPDCTAYHAVPEEGRIVRVPWRPGSQLTAARSGNGRGDEDLTEDLLVPTPLSGPPSGHFAPAPGTPVRQVRAVALLADPDGRLTLLDATDGCVLVLDLAEHRLVRHLRPPGTPVDLAAYRNAALVACAEPDAPLWQLGPLRPPRPLLVPDGPRAALPTGAVPSRVAVGTSGEVWLLWRDPQGSGWAVPVADDRTERVIGPIPGATDLELDGTAAVVVAGPPQADLRRFTFRDGRVAEERPLRAPTYDGRGLVRTPDGRIGYWGGKGVRTAFEARVRFGTKGWVDTFALDSGVYRQRWGRLFVDACLPPGTSLAVGFLTADDLPTEDGVPQLPHRPPSNMHTPLLGLPPGPPLAPADDAERLFGRDSGNETDGGPAEFSALYRRGPREVPWSRRDASDPFVTYEAPVNAPPGRYLWLRLLLTGTPQAAPRIQALRVERSGHRLLDQLPGIFSAEPRAAAFLDRFLALVSGPLADLDALAAERQFLLDPAGAPPELLPWLASLIGLTLDGRWPERTRRTMLAEAVDLFRSRGTSTGLSRMLEIYLGVAPVLVERFRFRNLGADQSRGSAAAGGAFADYAHRFAVVVPGALSDKQLATVRHLLDLHRPAHTLVEVCSADSGARVGAGWHLGLTSVVGRGSGFQQLSVGGALGRDAVLGRPSTGLPVGEGRIGADARVKP
ncbi:MULTISPECIES: phage tail protein [Streptomyces]|uniref:phage tail protein n=1 Tax=Streptomyces TaxID=1883 RepID=UPI000A3BECF9